MQRTVLAALALHRGRPVAVDSLVDLLWGDDPPPTAPQTLHVYLTAVRRALEPGRPARTPSKVLVTVAPGYALRIADEALDAARFDAAVGSAGRRLGGWSAAVAPPELTRSELVRLAGRLDEALASWRGIPYVDLGESPAAVAERARLEELRLVALESRAAARLTLGEHAMVAAELEALTAEHPLRERLWSLRVLALAGSGRQADALDALRRVRHILADELGLDPGAALRTLESAVLRQDPSLIWRPAPEPTAAPEPDRPLPPPAPEPPTPALDGTVPPAGPEPATPALGGTAPPAAPETQGAPETAAAREAAAPALDPVPQPIPVASGDPRQWPLVGRAAELATLESLLAETLGATPRFAVVAGEPGIGKTRLTQELAARASTQGFAVLLGRCSEDEGAPPMWPWIGVLRALLDSLPAAALPEAVRGDLTELADLASLRKSHGPPSDAPAHSPDDAHAAWFRLCDAVARVLAAASSVHPLLVLLEDLHWASASSLRLLRHLAEALHTGRVLVLATRRAHPEHDGALGLVAESLSRRHAVRVDLAGLSVPETRALVEAATDRTPSPREAELLRDRTDGNPFFLVELVRLLAGRGSGEIAEGLPAAVADVVARRIARLPAATGDLLRTASVIGRQFDLALLAAAHGLDEERVLDGLDPALAAGVIAEEETVDRFRFAHALVRDVMYAGLPAARRARRHAAVARALDGGERLSETARHWPDGGERLSETARHWLAAGPAHAARAWRAAAAAAEQARRLYAHEEAAALLKAALDAQRADASATPLDRYDLLMARADACRWAADQQGLHVALSAAVAEAERMNDIVRIAEAAVGTAEGAMWQIRPYGQVDENVVATLRKVLRELPAQDSELRCRAVLVLAGELYYKAGSSAYRDALVEQGLAMARRLGDPALLVWACQTAFLASWRAATAEERHRLAGEALEAAQQLKAPMWEAVARTLRAIAAGETGRIAEMREEARRARELAERLRVTYVLVVLGELEIPWLAMQGRFAECGRLMDHQIELTAGMWVPNREVSNVAGPMHAMVWQGRAAEGVPVLSSMLSGPFPVELPVVWLLVRAGRLDEARAACSGAIPPGDNWASLHQHCLAAEIAFALALPGLAAAAYQWLSPYAGRACSAGFGAAIGPVDAFLALAACAAGEREIAARHADDALRLCSEWEIPLAERWLRDQRDQGGF